MYLKCQIDQFGIKRLRCSVVQLYEFLVHQLTQQRSMLGRLRHTLRHHQQEDGERQQHRYAQRDFLATRGRCEKHTQL